MNKKIIVIGVAVILLIIAGVILRGGDKDDSMKVMNSNEEMTEQNNGSAMDETGNEGGGGVSVSGAADDQNTASTTADEGDVKEFSMDSFFVMEDGKPHPQFSVKEITVKKGDRVKINITNTAGDHNFNLDEFGVFTETPLNQTVSVEFVADKVGEFIYYCSKPGHRANGHWGTLKVTE